MHGQTCIYIPCGLRWAAKNNIIMQHSKMPNGDGGSVGNCGDRGNGQGVGGSKTQRGEERGRFQGGEPTGWRVDNGVDLKKSTTYTCSIYIHKITYKRGDAKPKKQ